MSSKMVPIIRAIQLPVWRSCLGSLTFLESIIVHLDVGSVFFGCIALSKEACRKATSCHPLFLRLRAMIGFPFLRLSEFQIILIIAIDGFRMASSHRNPQNSSEGSPPVMNVALIWNRANRPISKGTVLSRRLPWYGHHPLGVLASFHATGYNRSRLIDGPVL